MGVKISVKGLEAMRRTIAAMSKEIQKELLATNEKSADELVALLQRNIPVGDPEHGHLRDTIRKEPGRTELSVRVSEGDEEKLIYAGPLEFGHRDRSGKHVNPQPHFVPATTVVKKRHRGRASRAIKKAIDKTTKK